MKKRKLFYKDLSGLRFIGMLCIFLYVIAFILFEKESSPVSQLYLSIAGSLKNMGISIFVILSSFLLTAHGLREYKYTDTFNLKHFYYRRLLKILPVLLIALIFYIIAHPAMINLLKLTPIEGGSVFKNLFLLPLYRYNINREVFIYLYFIYGVLVLLQFYLVWGVILKYGKNRLVTILTILFIIGALFKIIGGSDAHAYYLYLPFYFIEITVGALTAIIIRGNSSIISYTKTVRSSFIFGVYLFGLISLVFAYFLTDSFYLRLVVKLYIYFLVGFFILEQTFAKHSAFKVRNSLFIIQFGNLSYSFVMFLPIISIITLIFFESIEIAVESKLIILIYPVLCLLLTWIVSYFFYHNVDRFFSQIRKEYK